LIIQPDLEQLLRENEFCAVIEVCNGISPRKIGEKAFQARLAREHIRKTSPYIAVIAGILAFRTRLSETDTSTYGLDFIRQIPSYEPLHAEQVLKSMTGPETPPRERHIANVLLALVRRGEPLEQLLYPARWRQFRRKFPFLAGNCRSPEQYCTYIQNAKGEILQRYALRHCAEAVPEATAIGPYSFTKKGFHRDIDIALIGDRETIMTELNDPRYFRKAETPILLPS
jgi:hypothetical protein